MLTLLASIYSWHLVSCLLLCGIFVNLLCLILRFNISDNKRKDPIYKGRVQNIEQNDKHISIIPYQQKENLIGTRLQNPLVFLVYIKTFTYNACSDTHQENKNLTKGFKTHAIS